MEAKKTEKAKGIWVEIKLIFLKPENISGDSKPGGHNRFWKRFKECQIDFFESEIFDLRDALNLSQNNSYTLDGEVALYG